MNDGWPLALCGLIVMFADFNGRNDLYDALLTFLMK